LPANLLAKNPLVGTVLIMKNNNDIKNLLTEALVADFVAAWEEANPDRRLACTECEHRDNATVEDVESVIFGQPFYCRRCLNKLIWARDE